MLLTLLILDPGLAAPATARAAGRGVGGTDAAGRRLLAQLRAQGQDKGEQHLALAALYARAGDQHRSYEHLRAAGRLQVEAGRLQFVLALLYRRLGRYDAALSALTRVLVEHPEQPQALLQLWKTVYEAQLRGARFQTDLGPVLERLDSVGMHLPARLDADPSSASESAKLSAAGYQQLLAGRLDQAVQCFEGAIEALPSNARAHRGLGIARAREQDPTRAAGAYQLYLELAPDAPDADRVDWVLMQYWRDRGSPH